MWRQFAPQLDPTVVAPSQMGQSPSPER
jgi:hypothetical protein